MIRHGFARMPAPVLPLTVTMILSRFRAVPVTAIGYAVAMQAALFAAERAAITLTTIASGTDKEFGLAFTTPTNPSPKTDLAVRRHTTPVAGLDMGKGFMAL